MKYKSKQADSFWIDITHETATTIDSVWPNWSGKWVISATVGSTPLLSGTIGQSSTPSLFKFRIGPASTSGWAVLPVGTYALTIEINNVTADYKHEEQHTLIIQTQGA
jgi:hypothetical protein